MSKKSATIQVRIDEERLARWRAAFEEWTGSGHEDATMSDFIRIMVGRAIYKRMHAGVGDAVLTDHGRGDG